MNMTLQSSSFDPIITFGKHKAEQKRLSDLDEPYLKFLTTPTKEGTDFFHRGLNWTVLAKQELSRRKGGPPVPSPGTDPLLPSEMDDGEIPEEPKRTELELSVGVIDDAAEFLLKEFITRREKSMRFREWLSDLAKEALRHGERENTGVPSITTVRYVKHCFFFRSTNDGQLLQQIKREEPRTDG